MLHCTVAAAVVELLLLWLDEQPEGIMLSSLWKQHKGTLS
jgi:hypothetical protein